MVAVPLQAMNQRAIQSVIISGNENRWIGWGCKGFNSPLRALQGPLPTRTRRLRRGTRKLPCFPPVRSLFGDYLYADCASSRGLMYREMCGVRAEQMRGAGSPLRGRLGACGEVEIGGCTPELWVRSRGGSQLSCPAFPEILEATAEFGAAEGDDGVGARKGPVHAGALEPGSNDYFAAGLQDTGGSAQTL